MKPTDIPTGYRYSHIKTVYSNTIEMAYTNDFHTGGYNNDNIVYIIRTVEDYFYEVGTKRFVCDINFNFTYPNSTEEKENIIKLKEKYVEHFI